MPKINPHTTQRGIKSQTESVRLADSSAQQGGGEFWHGVGINQEKKADFSLKEFLFRHKFIWLFAIFVALVAGFLSSAKGDKYTVSLAITVSRQGTQAATDYKYDNYYAIEASNEFGDTVAGWFKTPELTKSVNDKIGVDSSGWSLSSLGGRFQATKISPNLVEVRFGISNAPEAGQISDAINKVISDKIGQLNNASNQGIDFLAIVGQPVTAKNSFNFLWNALAGFLAGLVFGFFVYVAKDYLFLKQ